MKANEFDAVYQTTDLFAISLTPVEDKVPESHRMNKGRYGAPPMCPLGLVKAKVIEVGTRWTSTETFGCAPGSSRHEVIHRSGVLVEFDIPEGVKLPKSRHLTKKGKKALLVITKAAIVMPWSDYAPVLAARTKSQRESDRRSARIAKAMTAVGASHGSWNETYKEERGRDGRRQYEYKEDRATVQMPMVLAEQLGEIFAKLDEPHTAIGIEDELCGLRDQIRSRVTA